MSVALDSGPVGAKVPSEPCDVIAADVIAADVIAADVLSFSTALTVAVELGFASDPRIASEPDVSAVVPRLAQGRFVAA